MFADSFTRTSQSVHTMAKSIKAFEPFRFRIIGAQMLEQEWNRHGAGSARYSYLCICQYRCFLSWDIHLFAGLIRTEGSPFAYRPCPLLLHFVSRWFPASAKWWGRRSRCYGIHKNKTVSFRIERRIVLMAVASTKHCTLQYDECRMIKCATYKRLLKLISDERDRERETREGDRGMIPLVVEFSKLECIGAKLWPGCVWWQAK